MITKKKRFHYIALAIVLALVIGGSSFVLELEPSASEESQRGTELFAEFSEDDPLISFQPVPIYETETVIYAATGNAKEETSAAEAEFTAAEEGNGLYPVQVMFGVQMMDRAKEAKDKAEAEALALALAEQEESEEESEESEESEEESEEESYYEEEEEESYYEEEEESSYYEEESEESSYEEESEEESYYEEESSEESYEESSEESSEDSSEESESSSSSSYESNPGTTTRGATENTFDGSYYDLDYLAAICQIEAGSNYEGALAVANVVINRLNAGYASTIRGVIYAPYQFATGDMDYYLENGTSDAARQGAADALAGINNVGSYKCFNGIYWLDPATLDCPYTIIGGNVFY